MENRRAYAAAGCPMIAVVLALAGCSGSVMTRPAPAPMASSPVPLAVTQAMDQGRPRYVLCEAETCPIPTLKVKASHRIDEATGNVSATAGMPAAKHAPVEIDVTFRFNERRIEHKDLLRLHAAVSAAAPDAVTVTGRSDAIGPQAIRHRIALARAQAIHDAIREIRPDIAVTLDHEIATDPSAGTATRAFQRRATIRFTPSSIQQ